MKSSFGDTASLVETSSAIHNPDSLCRSTQYRSCLFRSHSEFLANPNMCQTTRTQVTSGGSTVSMLQDADCITCSTDSTTCKTEELINSELRSKSARSRFDKALVPSGLTPIAQNDNAFELWLVKKLKREEVAKEYIKMAAEIQSREKQMKNKRGSEAHKRWLQQKAEQEQRLRDKRQGEDQARKTERMKQDHEKRENKEKAEKEFLKWKAVKEKKEKADKQAARNKELKEKQEAEDKRQENEQKFKEWLKNNNETNPRQEVFTNKPWVPPIPVNIPSKRKQIRPHTARSRSENRPKPLLIIRQSNCYVDW